MVEYIDQLLLHYLDFLLDKVDVADVAADAAVVVVEASSRPLRRHFY